VLYHGALGGRYVPRAVLFDLDPGVIGAVTLSGYLAKFQPGQPYEPHAKTKKDWVKDHYEKVEHKLF
jgi:tubulin beta